MLPYDEIERFELDEEFLSDFRGEEPNWGYGDFSKVTYRRTYSREQDDGTQEKWFDTVRRVVEGVFNTQKAHCKTNHLPWDEEKARRTAQRMFKRMYDMKWLPPGRGLWMMGTDFVENRGSAPLNNCGFTSTENIDENFAEPFCWTFTMSMLGVGVGFDTRGKGKVQIQEPQEGGDVHVIGDSREGWTEALGRLLNAFVGDATLPAEWDYSEIRPKGAPIESFGGTASGPEPLKEMLETLEELYRDYIGEFVDSRLIVDTMNISGKCVVSGGVRRTAQLALSDREDEQFLDLKQDEEKLRDYRWASNNSIFAEVGMDYDDAADRTAANGEPGYVWLENMRKYGRTIDDPTWEDDEVMGFNPCKPLHAKILTPEGYITFEEAMSKDQLWVVTPQGDTVPAEGPFKTGVQKAVTRIELSNGAYLYGTENHKHRLKNDDWVEIADLEVGDQLSVTLPKVTAATQENKDDYELGIAMGWLWTDGTMYERSDRDSGYRLRWSIGEREFGYTDRLGEILGREAKPHPQTPNTCKLIEGVMSHARKFLDEGYSLDKSDLSWVRGKSDSFKTGFLRAVFTTDGSVRSKNLCVELYSVHEEALRVVQDTLAEFGIGSNICLHNKSQEYVASDGKPRNNKATYKISVRNDQFENIGFLTDVKQKEFEQTLEEREKASPDVSLEVVDSDRNHSIEDVYDITVPTSEHSFVDTGVVTHNCVEQTLEDRELCTLCETFPAHHDSFEDFRKTLKVAYLYAKTVTLIPTHDEKTNQVMLKNRRIGCSMSGIVQAIEKRGLREHLRWCDEGYEYIQNVDRIYSDWLGIPESIKTTSVKPSGTVSQLAGSTPGIHFEHSPFFIRRMRVQDTSSYWKAAEEAGYPIEDDVYSDNTKVIEFPVRPDYLERSESDVSIWEMVKMAALHQKWWSDNGVSCTVKFNEDEKDQIPYVLEAFERELKGISFLPEEDHGYEQTPYEAISEEEYQKRKESVEAIDLSHAEHEKTDKFCGSEGCEVNFDEEEEDA